MYEFQCPQCKTLIQHVEPDIPWRCPACGAKVFSPNAITDEKKGTGGGGTIVMGGLLLVGGAIGFFLSAPKMDMIRTSWGQLAAGFGEKMAREIQTWQYVYYGSIVSLVVGGVLCIVGAIQQLQKR